VGCDIYIPRLDEKVDMAIADFINNYDDKEKIKLLFLRRKAGEY